MGILSYKKLTFAAVNAVLFLVIASPPVYRIIGSIFGLKYDGETENNRISLLFIHSLVFALVTLVSINVYGDSGIL